MAQKWPKIAKMAQKLPKMAQKLAPAEKKIAQIYLQHLQLFASQILCSYVLLKMENRLPCTDGCWWYFGLISRSSCTTWTPSGMIGQFFAAAWDKKSPEFWQLQLQIGHRGTKSWCQNSKPNKMLVLALFLLSSVQPLPRQASDEVKLDLETLILNKTCLKK